jgi:1-acyl-sn-glycerol-3-phosphate acyltransferase
MTLPASPSHSPPGDPDAVVSPAAAPRPAGILTTVVCYLGFWVGLLACGVLFLGWCGIAFAISPLFEPARRRRIGRQYMQRLFCLYLHLLDRLNLVKVDNEDLAGLVHERGIILAPNHPSMLDVVLVIARLPDVGCVMKADLWGNIFLGAGAQMADFIRNDSPRSMIKRAVRDLKRGSQLLIFPEATRTVRLPVNPLSGGFALIAKQASAPVQTILIETDSPYLRKGWPLFRLPPLPITFRLRVGRRFEPRDDAEALTAEVERYFTEVLGDADPGREAAGTAMAGVGSHPPARRAA